MNGLEIIVYNPDSASIMDLMHDLDIGENRWDFIFDFLIEQSEAIYFNGFRLYYTDDGFDNAIENLPEEILSYKKDYREILFRVKQSSLIYNRNMMSQLWEYYEYPFIIFLKDKQEEQYLVDEFKGDYNLKNIEGIYMINRSFQQNVLWLKSNSVTPSISEIFNKSNYE